MYQYIYVYVCIHAYLNSLFVVSILCGVCCCGSPTGVWLVSHSADPSCILQVVCMYSRIFKQLISGVDFMFCLLLQESDCSIVSLPFSWSSMYTSGCQMQNNCGHLSEPTVSCKGRILYQCRAVCFCMGIVFMILDVAISASNSFYVFSTDSGCRLQPGHFCVLLV